MGVPAIYSQDQGGVSQTRSSDWITLTILGIQLIRIYVHVCCQNLNWLLIQSHYPSAGVLIFSSILTMLFAAIIPSVVQDRTMQKLSYRLMSSLFLFGLFLKVNSYPRQKAHPFVWFLVRCF